MEEDLQTLLDCFSGTDGGLNFVNFKRLLLGLVEIQSNPQNFLATYEEATKVLEALHLVAKMIERTK